MKEKKLKADILFSVSWEVCNKVGGIYTVLSTQAKTLHTVLNDNLVFLGPDLWGETTNPLFIEDNKIHADWVKSLSANTELKVRVGRWNIPGNPIVFLVDFSNLYSKKNEIYSQMWDDFEVDSLHGYGDYDESSMFSVATAMVVESFYKFNKLQKQEVVYQAHEWMCGMGALYLNKNIPAISTVFTTHATSIGRSIASNYKPLYDNLLNYDGDQMAQELNVESKHSIEKQTAHHVDCFTTVSDITANEAAHLLEQDVDIVLKNGFENDFVPKGGKFTAGRNAARKKLISVAQKVLGTKLGNDTLIVGTSGRYELKNKGLDAFVDAMNVLALEGDNINKDILAYIFVPAWAGEARQDLQYRLQNEDREEIAPLEYPYITHWLRQGNQDPIVNMILSRGLAYNTNSRVKIIFVPCYLNGEDGIFNMHYYDLLIGQDITVYPSYYEPWGYTPLESIAFKVPTITTSLSGFGAWVKTVNNFNKGLEDGVAIVERTDHNYSEVVHGIADAIRNYSVMDNKTTNKIRTRACKLSEKALWNEFIEAYYEAFSIAIQNKKKRLKTN